MRAAAGFSGTIAVGSVARALRDATSEEEPNASSPPGSDATYAKGALVAASVAPGLAPFVAARVGLGAQLEGGLTYTGRAVRADVRRSFELARNWSLGAGIGGSAALSGHGDGAGLPGVDLGALHGWGADVPVLVGYESDAGLYTAWLGARAGWEHVSIGPLPAPPGTDTLGAQPPSLSAVRLWAGGLFGLAAGFRHVHVAAELDVTYVRVTGVYNQSHTIIAGPTVAPATAMWWQF
jgi:hypothetical protein